MCIDASICYVFHIGAKTSLKLQGRDIEYDRGLYSFTIPVIR